MIDTMHFTPLIHRWGVTELASDLGLPTKNVRRWVDLDTIPSEWFAAVARASRRRGRPSITLTELAAMAEGKRLAKAARPNEQSAA